MLMVNNGLAATGILDGLHRLSRGTHGADRVGRAGPSTTKFRKHKIVPPLGQLHGEMLVWQEAIDQARSVRTCYG